MELQLGVDIDFFEKVLIRTLEQEIFHNLSSVIEHALKLSIGNYLSKFNHLIKNDVISDTVIKCIIPTTLTHGFGFNFLDRKLTFNLSTQLKIKKSEQGKIYFNPLIVGVNMEFFPIKSGYITNNGNFESDSLATLCDLSPQNKTMTLMRFPLKLQYWRTQNEKTLHRRTNYQSH